MSVGFTSFPFIFLIQMDLLWCLTQNVGVIDCIYYFDTNLIWKKTIRLKKTPQITALYVTIISQPTLNMRTYDNALIFLVICL